MRNAGRPIEPAIERLECALALHNLTADPGERRNLASAEPARVARMQLEMEAWLDDVYESRIFCMQWNQEISQDDAPATARQLHTNVYVDNVEQCTLSPTS